jgi:hypothetical protein
MFLVESAAVSAKASSQNTKPQPRWPTGQASSPLTLEFLAWIASRPRTYAEAIEAWRSNCPRHSIWDDALTDGLVKVVRGGATGNQSEVSLTALGRATLDGRSELRSRATAVG